MPDLLPLLKGGINTSGIMSASMKEHNGTSWGRTKIFQQAYYHNKEIKQDDAGLIYII